MKDVKVYDGAGWQSLKGPPGPSTPSADAGNIITKGSDGLLRVTGETQYSGEWTPIGSGGIYFPEGYWTRTGKAVNVTLLFQILFTDVGVPRTEFIDGLPFSVSEYFSPNSGSTGQYCAPVIHVTGGVIGYCNTDGQQSPTGISLYTKGPYDDTFATINLTYLTEDANIR